MNCASVYKLTAKNPAVPIKLQLFVMAGYLELAICKAICVARDSGHVGVQ